MKRQEGMNHLAVLKGQFVSKVERVAYLAGLVILVCSTSCKRKHSIEVTPTASVAASTSHGSPPSGLDPCLIGNWKSIDVSSKYDQLVATGGNNVLMKIRPTGASIINFAYMTNILATRNAYGLDYRYSGRLRALFGMPSTGKLTLQRVNYSELRVTANVMHPGAPATLLIDDKPITSLARSGQRLDPSEVANPHPPQDDPTRDIDATPIVSTDAYTCSGETLTLRNTRTGSRWTFSRIAQQPAGPTPAQGSPIGDGAP